MGGSHPGDSGVIYPRAPLEDATEQTNEKIQADPDIVRAAVHEDGAALEFAAPALRQAREDWKWQGRHACRLQSCSFLPPPLDGCWLMELTR